MYERLIAGTDFSKTARIATDRAAQLAQGLGAELTLVHAGPDPDGQLEDLAKEYGGEASLVSGNPAEALISEFERLKGDLLVVGSVGMSGAKRFLLGSVPNKVSHHASGDLLIVKTDPPPKAGSEYKKILVGTDGSPTATRAVDAASDFAKKLGARATIVTVYEPPSAQELETLKADPNDPVAQWSSPSAARDVPSEFRWRIAGAAQAEDVLERARDHAQERGAEVDVKAVEGNPAEALVSLAETDDFDLIVVGSVGMTGAKRFMLGNVPHRVSHHAPTDVLILHTT